MATGPGIPAGRAKVGRTPPLQNDELKNTFECGPPPKRLIPRHHDTNLKLHYETRFEAPQFPSSPPVGHTVHNTEKSDSAKAHEQISPTSEQSSTSINERIDNNPILLPTSEEGNPKGWNGKDHVPRYPTRATKSPYHLKDYDCANLVETMILAMAIEKEFLNMDSEGKPLSYRTATCGPNAAKWRTAFAEELIRLTEETETIQWNGYQTIPKGTIPTYCSIVVKEKIGERSEEVV